MSGRATGDLLIDAAEGLLAQKPLNDITVAEITTLAGQRNRSALQYHFGTKRELLVALLRRHQTTLTAVRSGVIRDLDEAGVDDVARRLAAGLVLPLSTFVHGSDGQQAYLKVAADLSRDLTVPRADYPALIGEPLIWQLFGTYAGDETDPGWALRVHRAFQATFMVFNALSDRSERTRPGHEFLIEFESFVSDTIEVTHAVLSTGVTPAPEAGTHARCGHAQR